MRDETFFGEDTALLSSNDTCSYAERLALRVFRVLEKHLRANGFETDALLLKKERKPGLGISDDGSGTDIILSAHVKIIVTSHDSEMFPMKLGDNPEQVLDFIWLPDGNEETDISEGMTIRYNGSEYTVTIVSPVILGESIVIKECRANMVR